MTSHHPTSAELDDFRRLLHTHSDELQPMHPGHGGATESERERGIGYRESEPHAMGWHHSVVRGNASAMRSRAYAAMVGVPTHDRTITDYERYHGIPYFYGRMPIVASDTWSEDDPCIPLPVTYHPAVSITR